MSQILPNLVYLEDEAGEVDALVELPPLELVLVELVLFAPAECPVDVLHTAISVHSCDKGRP